jgi:hypothetical protein
LAHPLDAAVEQHATAATLYLTGTLSVRLMLRAIGAVQQLPQSCSVLRVDVSAVEGYELRALRLFRTALSRWETERDSRVVMNNQLTRHAVLP